MKLKIAMIAAAVVVGGESSARAISYAVVDLTPTGFVAGVGVDLSVYGEVGIGFTKDTHAHALL
ncbi:MAG TPA: hypothetical protein VKJ65_08335, partial [Phycisphaerae bacterium]|nr:hypothetical protein [Phycisphaerae bacterium]